MSGKRNKIYELINLEREQQIEKWGEQEHAHERWLMILMEEFGEVAQAILQGRIKQMPVELVQSAAVIVAWLEQYLASDEIVDHFIEQWNEFGE